MPPLHELQQAFGRGLSAPLPEQPAAGLFAGPENRLRTRFAVYRANIEGNCAAALAAAYPIVRKIVGESYFEHLARDFARAHGSRSGDLNLYGESLPAFIVGYDGVADLPYLRDVAHMEWLAHLAYYAGDARVFDSAALAATPSERHPLLRPRLAPACALLSSAWPIGRIWTVHQDDYDGALDVDLRRGPEHVLVHRPRWRAAVETLPEGDFRFLLGALRGEELGIAIDAAAAADPAFDPSIALAKWIHAKVIDRLV